MKQFYTPVRLLLAYLITLFITIPALAQQVPVTLPPNTVNNVAGYYEALQQGYNDNTSKTYPLIVFMHGVGELQYDADNKPPRPMSVVLRNGIPNLIERNLFPASFSYKGQDFSFIVISPQFIRWPGADDANKLVAYLKTKYRIDENRIYITGLSMGGGVAWGAISENAEKAKQYAAAAMVCGAYNPNDRPELAGVIAANNTPVWAFHNRTDPTVDPNFSITWVKKINSSVPAPNPLAKLTLFQQDGHNAWDSAYNPKYKDPVTGLNVYEWMLSYSKGATVPPPPTGNKKIIVKPSSNGNQIYYNDAMNQLKVSPGDTLCIPAGDYDYIQFGKLAGTADKPIVIMNCGGLVRVGVNSTATAASFVFSTCSYFKLEGTGDPSLKYGFDINGTNKQGEKMFGLFFGDGTTDMEVHHAFVHDASMFVQAKTLQSCSHPEWWEASFVMRNVKIHDLLCRNSTWEGFYIGNTHYLYTNGGCTDMKSHHIENLEVYNNDLENMGSDGIQIAMADLGDNKVYNNRVVNYAIARNGPHGYGIMSGGGSTLKIYNNRIDKGYNPGIQIFGSGINYVYNNVVSNITYEGINVIDKLVFQPATGYIYNNTVYNTGSNGLKIYADLTTIGHKVYNNIVIAPGTQWDYPQSGYYIKGSTPVKFDFANNLSYKTPEEAGLADAAHGNFRLLSGSKAIDAGRDMSDMPMGKDLDNTSRPQNGKYDIGAYEYLTGSRKDPVANAGADIYISAPASSATLDGSGSTGTDGTITSWSWKMLSGPSGSAIADPGGKQTSLSGLVPGAYVYQLTVTDSNGKTASDEVSVFVLPGEPRLPVVKMPSNTTITLPNNSFQLDGSSSYDPDGVIVSYEWTKKSGPVAASIGDPTSANTTVSGLTEGVYVFELTVTNSAGTKASATVTVTVQDPASANKPPVANAGVNITITLPVNSVTLDGSASTDPDGTIASWSWAKVSGPASGNIVSATTAKTNVTNLIEGTYVYELTVTDNKGAKAAARVTVTVLPAPPNKAPIANAGSNITVTLPSNSATLDGTASKDQDGSIEKWSWVKLSGPNGGDITNAASSKTTITNLSVGTYVYQLTVTDNNNATSSATVKVTVLAPPNKPPVANAGSNITITLPVNTANLDGSASSDPDGSISKWSWVKVSGPAGGNISSAGSAKTAITGLQQGAYVYQLTVTDNSNESASATVTVTVLPEAPKNQPPVANAGADITITLPVNTTNLDGSASSDPDGSISKWSWVKVSGPAGGNISSAGSAKTAITGLQQGAYVYQLTVTDNSNESASATVTVTVLPEVPKNQPPVANAGADITITLPVNTASLNGSASSDPDGSIATWQWTKVSGPAGGAITAATSSTTSITGLVEGTYIYELKVADDKGATATARVTVTVLKAPVTGKPPVAVAGEDVVIDLPVNIAILDGGLSYDPDGTIVGWKWNQLSGPADANIIGGTNQVASAGGLKKGEYVFQLTVTDNDGMTGSATKRVTVKDPTDGHESQDSLKVSLYPNLLVGGAKARLVITNRELKTAQITIYNSQGVSVSVQQVPLTSGVYTTDISGAPLGNGIYYVEVRGDAGYKWVGRLVKM
ncbi:Alpha/beta hydrolase family protein [Chitinophaga terrae (ex Kim and Jung 2007)]|uniref:Alpha/beta hydrolase family protein n=1 Tax=Chitinophaga terrae (ex Kim and Jung 2007) TaxID=408074 RepID=A0A1H4CBW7_9BACT|nr:PKD domain-containing protein [Chitinophaga terrae (ex Kim and Jung 2007)]SEA57830.1 Alpha/beta hydrolase family protein [Chitinophaga terrae (ex Kim and Jung 2007)]